MVFWVYPYCSVMNSVAPRLVKKEAIKDDAELKSCYFLLPFIPIKAIK